MAVASSVLPLALYFTLHWPLEALANGGLLPTWDKRLVLHPPYAKELVSPGLASGLALANRTQWARLGCVVSGSKAVRPLLYVC